MDHTSVDVRTEMGDWPGRIGSAPAHAAPFGLHVPRLPNINLGFSLLGQCLAAGKCAKSTITRLERIGPCRVLAWLVCLPQR
jgi:hypothetical protein